MVPDARNAGPLAAGPALLIAAGIALAVLVPLAALALRMPYLSDDWWLVGCFEAQGTGTSLKAILAGTDESAVGRFYRPLWRSSHLLDAVAGARPALSHGLNLALHGACAAALFGLGRGLDLSRSTAGWAALLFLVHPACVQPVTWVAGRTDLLGLLFALTALGLLLRGSVVWMLLALVAGLLSKETAFVALPIALLLLARGAGPGETRARHKLGLAMLGVGIAVLALRWSLLGDPLGGHTSGPLLKTGPWGEQFVLWGQTAGLSVWPWDTGSASRAIAGVLVPVTAALAWRRAPDLRPALALGAGLFALSLLVLQGLGAGSYLEPNGRFTYAPVAGLALVLGSAIGAWPGRAAAFAGVGLVALLGAANLHVQRAVWRATEEIAPRLALGREASAAAEGPTALLGLPLTCGPLWIAPYFTSFGLGPPFERPGPRNPVGVVTSEDLAEGRLERAVFRGLGSPRGALVPLAPEFGGESIHPNAGPVLRYDPHHDGLTLEVGESGGLVRLLAESADRDHVARNFGKGGTLLVGKPQLVKERLLQPGRTVLESFTAEFGRPGSFRLQAAAWADGRVRLGPSLELTVAGRAPKPPTAGGER